MNLRNVQITDDLKNIITSFKKTGGSFEPIPGANWELVSGSLKIIRSPKAGTSADYYDSFDLAPIISSAGVDLENILIIDFGTNEVNDRYEVIFIVELDISKPELVDIFKQNGVLRLQGNKTKIISSDLHDAGVTTPGTGNTDEIKNEVLGKIGKYQKDDQQVDWTINLNQRRILLDETSVVDTLPLGLTLDPTSVKLYKNVIKKDGTFLTPTQLLNELSNAGTNVLEVPVTYTYELETTGELQGRWTLTIQLPENKTDYILQFSTDVSSSLIGEAIVNEAYYQGTTSDSTNSGSSEIIMSGSSSGSSIHKSEINVSKLNKETGALVGGSDNTKNAEFTLYWLPNGKDYPGDKVLVRSLFATNGSALFRGLTRGQWYGLVESKSPEGYLLDDPNLRPFQVPATAGQATPPMTFLNTPIKTASWQIKGIKQLDGKPLNRDFQFVLKDAKPGEAGTTIMTGGLGAVINGQDKEIDFTNVAVNWKDFFEFENSYEFPEAAPFGTVHPVAIKKLYLFEKADLNAPGYGFDDNVFELEIVVTSVKGENDLRVVVYEVKPGGSKENITNNNGKFLIGKTPTFKNTYRADGSIIIGGEKTVTGHSFTANQFTFELYDSSNALLQTTASTASGPKVGDKYPGRFEFDAISYSQYEVGEHRYKIVERNTGQAGYTYDVSEYEVVVWVSDNNDGTLKGETTSITRTNDGIVEAVDKVLFENLYTTQDANININAKKTLTGRTIEDNQFSFKIEQFDSLGTGLILLGTAFNVGENINLPTLTYTQADIGKSFSYKITEIDDSAPGYTYDDTVYMLTVTVSDNHDGTLGITRTLINLKTSLPASQVLFSNSYNALGSGAIEGAKTLNGKPLSANKFEFLLQEMDGAGDDIGLPQTIKNKADGTFKFNFDFTEEDAGSIYYYRLTEKNDGVSGYTYDNTNYIVSRDY